MDDPSERVGSSTGYGRYHPFGWRLITWVLLAVDAFVAAFLAGLALGYRRISPASSDASEGFALLVVFVVGAALILNAALLLVWIATAIAARRRAVDRAVHRWAWIAPTIALGAGVALGMSLITGWYSGEHILSAGSLRTWVRVPDADGLFAGPGSQVMNEVTQGGPGFVAVGFDGLPADEDAAVWVSSDRTTWQRVDQQVALGGARDQVMNGIVAGPVLVAVGRDGAQGDDDAAVWTSADGMSWSRVPHDELILGGDGDQVMRDVAIAGPGLVAVGSDRPEGPEGREHAAVWTSVDGLSWVRVPDDRDKFGDGGSLITAVDAGGPWNVAVGDTMARARGDPAPVWMSEDGVTWSREPDETGVFEGARLLGVTVGGPGLVAVGGVGGDAAVWTASPPDNVPWSRLPHDESVFGGDAKAVINDVLVVGSTLIAVGGESWPASPTAEVWISADGITWSRVSGTTSLSNGFMNAVAGDGRGLVAVGIAVGDDGNPDAAIWVTAEEV